MVDRARDRAPAAPPGREEDAGALRPRVVVSECLGFGAVRYNGQLLRSRFVDALRESVRFVPVCPEVGIGLGVPRDPVRLVDEGRGVRMVQPASGRDLTGELEAYTHDFLSATAPVDGFILKNRSPTCGIGDVRIRVSAGSGSVVRKGSGFFASIVRARFPLAAVEDEGRLTNYRIRHHFLSSLFTVARFRFAREQGSMEALVRFQTEHKLLLMARSQDSLRRLGRIAAGSEDASTEERFSRYADTLALTLRTPPRPGPTVNVLQHAFGHLSGELTRRERAYFLELVEGYRAQRVPLAAVLAVLRAWIVRQGEPYLEGQRFFEPYPPHLLDLTDSGKGREFRCGRG